MAVAFALNGQVFLVSGLEFWAFSKTQEMNQRINIKPTEDNNPKRGKNDLLQQLLLEWTHVHLS